MERYQPVWLQSRFEYLALALQVLAILLVAWSLRGLVRRLIARLLSESGVAPKTGFPDRKTWVSRLRRIGVDEAGLLRWHALFELQDPKGHEAFLEMLGFGEEEIRDIRRRLPPLPGDR